MTEEIGKALADEEVPENIRKLFDYCQRNISRSRGEMGKHYARWRRNQKTYQGIRPADADDRESREDETPEKFVVPLSYAQVNTAVTFCFLLFTQNSKFFQFDQGGDEDKEVADMAEKLLHGELRENQWNTKLFMALVDYFRYGIAITRESWTVESRFIPTNNGPVVQDTPFGTKAIELPDAAGDREVTAFEGNKIYNVSPFKWFPDLSLPMSRWREGKFCADEDLFHISRLDEWEKAGLLAGVEHIKAINNETWKGRQQYNNFSELESEVSSRRGTGTKNETDRNFLVVLAEHYVRLIPSKYGLGPEDYEKMFLVRIANDQRIVSIDPFEHVHSEFPYNAAVMTPDSCTELLLSLSDVADAIQDVISYLINGRIMAVKKSLGRNLIVNPSVIDVESLKQNLDIGLTKSGAPANGLERYVMQLNWRDTTMSNFADADSLQRILSIVTGVNENAMGLVAQGRRSATENRAANGGAASRLKVLATLFWDELCVPQAKKQITNLRYGLSFTMFSKYLGKRDNLEELYSIFVPADPAELVGARDFFIFDNTTTNEKLFMAQAMQDLLTTLLTSPVAMQYDVNEIIQEIYRLRGVEARRFRLVATPQIPGAALPGAAPGALPPNPGQPAV